MTQPHAAPLRCPCCSSLIAWDQTQAPLLVEDEDPQGNAIFGVIRNPKWRGACRSCGWTGTLETDLHASTAATVPVAYCPRCNAPRGVGALLCATCWPQVPVKLRKRWAHVLLQAKQGSAARAILTWAKPPVPAVDHAAAVSAQQDGEESTP